MKLLLSMAERGALPDAAIRLGIRRLNEARLRSESRLGPEAAIERQRAFIEAMNRSPVALVPEKANEQHYEVEPGFFELALGPRLKYSCCLYEPGTTTLAEAEERMLALTCERAQLEDGMRILELGCGWGSLTHWMAQRYPNARITAVSNSAPQRGVVERRCAEANRNGVRVITADMNEFDPGETFDRVVSVEMFEHMRNWGVLLNRVSDWLNPGGKLFIHIFCHRELAYPFELEEGVDWMARYFFSGGMMPSENLLLHFQRDLHLEDQWRVSGTHYARTARAWLENMDHHKEAITPLLARAYGPEHVKLWRQRWRIFFMACKELFAARGGGEWFVAHYRMAKR
ncbi:MAG: methyltransferase domain-containing protein [bacterium]|nr:methyltransferase domain-containing protein [bacterium]